MVDVTSAVIVCDAGDGARGNCRRYLRVAAVRWVVGDIKKWWVMVVRGEDRQRKKKKKKKRKMKKFRPGPYKKKKWPLGEGGGGAGGILMKTNRKNTQ